MEEKLINEEEEIEIFIDWLKKFYLSSAKQKTRIIKRVKKSNETFGKWLTSVMDFNFDMQDKLIEELRYAKW